MEDKNTDKRPRGSSLRARGTAKNSRFGEMKDKKKYPKPREDILSLHSNKECNTVGPEKME
jgi:hypothetical protein